MLTEKGRHLKAVVAYDGTAYHGFQVQANAVTVQEVLQRALAQVTRESIAVRYAGRTDTGVHAIGQVVDFWTHWDRPRAVLHRAWNAVLPEDVAICELTTAAEDFHARFSARSRIYRYSIWNDAVRAPLLRRTHWHVSQPLDTETMAEAAQCLVGEHDFRAFGAPMQPQGSTVRVVERVQVWRKDQRVFLEIEANAFLRRMARRMVQALVDVGCGRLTAAALSEILRAADPARLQGAAPAHGLCLIKVTYE